MQADNHIVVNNETTKPKSTLSKIALIFCAISAIFALLPFVNAIYLAICWLSYVFGVFGTAFSIIAIFRHQRFAIVSATIAIICLFLPMFLTPEYAAIAIDAAKTGSYSIVNMIDSISNKFIQ